MRVADSSSTKRVPSNNPLDGLRPASQAAIINAGVSADVSKQLSRRELGNLASRIDNGLNSSLSWSLIVLVLTFWALYIDDIKTIALPKDIDLAIISINYAILSIFSAEFVLAHFATPGYACSMQALMDLLAVVSLIPFEEITSELFNSSDFSVARIARAARATRILRATRAAAMALKAQRRFRTIARNKAMTNGDAGSGSVLEDTLLHRTNIKMLLGILILLMGAGFLELETPDRTVTAGLEVLDTAYQQYVLVTSGDSSGFEPIWRKYEHEVQADSYLELKLLVVRGELLLWEDTESLRRLEKSRVEVEPWTGTYAEVSMEQQRVVSAWYSMALTTFAVGVILVWTGSFIMDHERFVLRPVHRMIGLLREMAKDPRMAMLRSEKDLPGGTAEGAVTEIEEIEICLSKFGMLLRVGFGEAGMDVVSKNLNATGLFNPMIPGSLVMGVFGFCDIRNFTDCCEVLNEDTFLFTNQIAQIVHDLVEESGGAVNKNIGDAFLSVWKLRSIGGDNDSMASSVVPVDAPAQQLSTLTPASAGTASSGMANKRSQQRYAHHLTKDAHVIDMCLEAFTKTHQALQRNVEIQELAKDERLQKKLPGYRVKMGFGLHLGWAVEGAVGSKHKVDATYLSPNVNMASRLEAATKQYGVNILISHFVVEEMSPNVRKQCRAIDRVTVKGSSHPIELYCHMPTEAPHMSEESMLQWMADWEEAYALYVNGEAWTDCAAKIEALQSMLPDDGPCQVLLELLDEHDRQAPADWPGFHALLAK